MGIFINKNNFKFNITKKNLKLKTKSNLIFSNYNSFFFNNLKSNVVFFANYNSKCCNIFYCNRLLFTVKLNNFNKKGINYKQRYTFKLLIIVYQICDFYGIL